MQYLVICHVLGKGQFYHYCYSLEVTISSVCAPWLSCLGFKTSIHDRKVLAETEIRENTTMEVFRFFVLWQVPLLLSTWAFTRRTRNGKGMGLGPTDLCFAFTPFIH